MWPRVFGLMLVVLLARLAVYPVNEYLAGDAVSRVELAERWAANPHIIRSFSDGTAQYGPLQLYLVGGALQLVDRNDAAKLVNLVFGVLTVIPLFSVTRLYFGARAATWACLAFAAWGLHVQLSTTGGSEALALCLMWLVFAAFASALEQPRTSAFARAAIWLNFAAATRYDAWMYIPLLSVLPLVQWADKRTAVFWGALFFVCCLPYPVFWMLGNAAAHGDPFYPFTYINEFHRQWVGAETHAWGGLWFRVQGLGFWPAMAIITLTPGVALFGAIGMVRSVRQAPATRWLVLAAAVPATYYALRSAVLTDFVPLARFTVLQVSLLLPFVWPGFRAVVAGLREATARRLTRLSIALTLVMPTALGLYTLFVNHSSADILETISPTTTNNRSVMSAAAFVRDVVVGGGHTIALDEDATYQDIQLGFYGRVTDAKTLRLRWPEFRQQFEKKPPSFVVLFDKGRLIREPGVGLSGGRLSIGPTAYDEVSGFGPPVRIFRR
jgi:hypothetical protein